MRSRLLVLIASLLVLPLASVGCDTTYQESMDHAAEGMRAYNAEQTGKAVEELKKAIQIYPENHEAHFNLGMIYNGRTKVYHDAVKHFGEAAKLRPQFGKYWYFLGAAHQNLAALAREQGEKEEARSSLAEAKKAFKEAVSVDEYYAEAYFRLGRVHEELGELGEAIDAYGNAVNSDATLVQAYQQLGMLYGEYAFLDEAAQVLRNGVANNPEDVRLQGELGNVYLDKESFLEAIDHFEKAFKLHEQKKGDKLAILPSYYGRAQAHNALGNASMLGNDFPEAIKQFKEAKGFFLVFSENATGDEMMNHRMSAGAEISSITTKLESLEKGELPKEIRDQRKMLEEATPPTE